MSEEVDWQRQVAEFASKGRKHSDAVDSAQRQVFGPAKGEPDYWEAVYTLAVQRFHMGDAGADGGVPG